MKTLSKITIVAIIGLFTLVSCNQKMDSTKMLQNPEMRSQMMTTIMNDKSMMTEFFGMMKENKGAMQMMQNNQGMMQGKGMEMMQGKMKEKMMNNPEMMKSMMQNMMKDGSKMKMMMQMMKDKGMMDEKSMKTCMAMMKGKGMNMMGNMNMDKNDSHSHKH